MYINALGPQLPLSRTGFTLTYRTQKGSLLHGWKQVLVYLMVTVAKGYIIMWSFLEFSGAY